MGRPMESSEQLRSLFSAPVEETADSYVIEVPRSEVDGGSVDATENYQVALLRCRIKQALKWRAKRAVKQAEAPNSASTFTKKIGVVRLFTKMTGAVRRLSSVGPRRRRLPARAATPPVRQLLATGRRSPRNRRHGS